LFKYFLCKAKSYCDFLRYKNFYRRKPANATTDMPVEVGCSRPMEYQSNQSFPCTCVWIFLNLCGWLTDCTKSLIAFYS